MPHLILHWSSSYLNTLLIIGHFSVTVASSPSPTANGLDLILQVVQQRGPQILLVKGEEEGGGHGRPD